MSANLTDIALKLQCSNPRCPCQRATTNGNLMRHCPAHDDAHPSLSLTQGKDGVLWKCHAKCSQQEVTTALKDRDIIGRLGQNGRSNRMPPTFSKNGHETSKNGHKPQNGPVVRDEIRHIDGTVIAVHCRRGTGPGKHVWWERPDGSKTLGGSAVEELPLYGAESLPALPDGAEVAVLEGEPAKKALQLLGIPAVGTVTGAKTIPYDDVLQHLVRLSPVLWPDNDDDGRRHMTRIAARLVDLGCESVKVTDWPDAPDKGDAADAVVQGVDVRALLAASRPWTPDKAKLPDEMPDSEEVQLQVTSLQDVVPEQVKPLWPKRIFLGKLTVIAGDPGLGKSYASLDITARVSLGGPWPDGSGYAPQGNVLLLSAEDGLADTIEPRLELLGADMSRIYSLGLTVRKGEGDISLSLQEHVPQIEQFLVEKEIILLVVDPLLAFTGKVDTHKTAEVRGVLSPLAAMAQWTGCAILAVMHPNKNSKESNLLYRITASLDFAAAARSVMVVTKHPDNSEQRVMATVKCNLSAHPEPMAFMFTADGCFTWQGVTEVDVSQLMAPTIWGDTSARQDAAQFLAEVLAGGELPAKQVLSEAWEYGISEITLRRVAKELQVDIARLGKRGKKGGGQWVWRLPPEDNDLDDHTPRHPGDHLNNLNTEQVEIIKVISDHLNELVLDDHLNQAPPDINPDQDIKMITCEAREMIILIEDPSPATDQPQDLDDHLNQEPEKPPNPESMASSDASQETNIPRTQNSGRSQPEADENRWKI